jgi:hypothetical protein
MAAEAAPADAPAKSIKMTPERLRAEWVWCVGPKRFIRRRDCVMWDVAQFDSEFGYMTPRGGKPSQELFRSLGKIVKFDKLAFHPGRDEYDFANKSYNTWRPSLIAPKQGDTRLWDNHLMLLFPDALAREQLLDWLAWVYQHQAKKPNHALLIVGEMGTGKSYIARVMEFLIGKENTQRPKNSSLKGDFNGWAMHCKLAIFEELMQIGRREVANELRDMITEPHIEVNIKNVPAFMIENFMAMMAISNHTDALPLETGERRWLVLESPMTKDEKDDLKASGYFTELMPMVNSTNPDVEALAAIAYQLQHRDVGDYNGEGEAPMTDAKERMIDLSKSSLETWLGEFRYELEGRALVNIPDDIIERIPPQVIRDQSSRGALHTVAKFLTKRLHGVNLGDHRVAGRGVIKLWALGDLGKAMADKRDRLTTKATGEKVQGVDGVSFGAMYAAERAAVDRSVATPAEPDEFGI